MQDSIVPNLHWLYVMQFSTYTFSSHFVYHPQLTLPLCHVVFYVHLQLSVCLSSPTYIGLMSCSFLGTPLVLIFNHRKMYRYNFFFLHHDICDVNDYSKLPLIKQVCSYFPVLCFMLCLVKQVGDWCLYALIAQL